MRLGLLVHDCQCTRPALAAHGFAAQVSSDPEGRQSQTTHRSKSSLGFQRQACSFRVRGASPTGHALHLALGPEPLRSPAKNQGAASHLARPSTWSAKHQLGNSLATLHGCCARTYAAGAIQNKACYQIVSFVAIDWQHSRIWQISCANTGIGICSRTLRHLHAPVQPSGGRRCLDIWRPRIAVGFGGRLCTHSSDSIGAFFGEKLVGHGAQPNRVHSVAEQCVCAFAQVASRLVCAAPSG